MNTHMAIAATVMTLTHFFQLFVLFLIAYFLLLF
ncbi:hypothetical protein [Hungatella hathewayi]